LEIIFTSRNINKNVIATKLSIIWIPRRVNNTK